MRTQRSLSRLSPQQCSRRTASIGIHDPSTITLDNGKYYVYGTGGGPLVSDDGWTWRRGVMPLKTGTGPRRDSHRRPVLHVCRAGDGAAASCRGQHDLEQDPGPEFSRLQVGGRGHDCAAQTGWKTATPSIRGIPGPHHGPVVAGVRLLLWLYPAGGAESEDGRALESEGDTPRNLAINCEASDMIYHDGWYYLLATHGSCCAGADSGYNIRLGRSRAVTGPFLDGDGVDMIQGGGKLLIGSGGRYLGAGHFGLLDLGDGVREVFDALGGRSGQGRRERAGYSSPALEGRLAGCGGEAEGRHV